MSDTVYRLLGPNHNRLITVHPSPVQGMAQVNYDTAEKLKTAGWTRYSGTAQEEDGWVVPGTDPNLRPRTSFKVDI